ncbi:diacylglycerol kinase [Cryptosporidium xiaoi]|uniref:Diacylglycerol kinase n=1 Tax=Cryptosporidium xiaoi TaxID=659607 RepID=A0AAV9XX39_9CRYT
MAFTSTNYHLTTLTAKHWYIIILFILTCSMLVFFTIFYFQNHYNYNILKHIKLRHNWVLYETPEYPKYCTNCSEIIKKRSILMKNYEGWQCLFCKRISHLHCIMQSDSQYCKIESLLNNIVSNISDNNVLNRNSSYGRSSFDNGEAKDLVHLHVLIKGNLHSGALCSICRTICFSPFGLAGQRCVWCNRTFHDKCAYENNISNQKCDLGTLKYIILPPNSFALELIRTNKGNGHAIDKFNSIFHEDFKKDLHYKNPRFRKPEDTPESISLKSETFYSSPQRRRISEFIQMIPKSTSYERKLRFCNDFLTNKSEKPLLVFVNTRSGGHFGQKLIKDLYFYLNPIQIVDIQTSKGPDEALILFKELATMNRLLILICGGDGTVRWVIDRCREIYGFDSEKLPPIATLPLGTGNDLSRILGWDVSFDGDIFGFLKRICTSNIRKMDIWNCSALEIDNRKPENINSQNLIFSSTFLNYLDIGIAARIALKFHNLREEYPQHFNSRFGNQLVYGEVGLKDFFLNKSIQLDGLRIWCDGEEVNILNNVGKSRTDGYSSNNIQSSKVQVSRIQKISYFLSKDNEFFFVFTFLKYIFLKIIRIVGFLGIDNKILSENTEETENRVHSKKNQRLEGLVICNIPSFAGGVNLWKVSRNYSKSKTQTFFTSKDTGKPNKIACKNTNERSMSFSIGNARDSDCLSCEFDSSDNSEFIGLDYKFSNDRIRSINKLKNWFSSAFSSFPIISRQEHFTLSSDSEDFTSKFEHQKIDDGLIEVVGIRSLFHLTQLQVGLTEPIKLCQGSDIVVEIPKQIPFQVDGEPRIINKCRLNIKSLGKIHVLCSEKIENTIPLSVKNALELAVQKNIVNNSQRDWIAKQILKESRI